MARFRSNHQGRQVCHRLEMPEVLLRRRTQRALGKPLGQAKPAPAVAKTPQRAPEPPLPQRVLQPLPPLGRKAESVRQDEGVQDAIQLLERRLQKLAGALESQEELLLRMRQQESQDAGVASNFRQVQGLPEGAPGSERKQELMRRIFESNQELRERITSLRRLAE